MNDPYGLQASGLPPELLAKFQGMTQQQAIAQALMQQSQQGFQPPESKGRFQGAVSPMEVVAKAMQAYMGSKGQQDANAGMAGLAAERQQGVESAMSAYQRQKTGMPAQEMPQPVPMDDEGNAMPAAIKDAVPGDRRAAIASAMVNPYLRNNPLVSADLKALEKEQEPFSLRSGEKRFQGGSVIATNAQAPTVKEQNGKFFAVDPNAPAPVRELGGPGPANDPNKPFNPDGSPNSDYQQYAKGLAGAGATRVQTSVNTGKQFYENIQEAVGKEVADGVTKAKGAVATLNTVGQIRDALDTGKVSAGPGTTVGQFLGQIGQVIGVSGKDEAEKLTQTRTAMQGLATLELNAAQQMKGQGAITQPEREIIKRASAGDIDTMTVPELRTLMDVLDRSARNTIAGNRKNVDKLRGQPGAASIVEFMDVQEPPPYQPQRRAADKAQVMRFDNLGNPVP